MYVKTNNPWVDGPTNPIDAEALNNIENGIVDLYNWQTKTNADSGTSVVAFNKVFVDTTGGAFNLILPATPAIGDTCRFVDVAGNFSTANFTVNVAAGDKFMGVVDDFLLLTADHNTVEITFSGATYGWVITQQN